MTIQKTSLENKIELENQKILGKIKEIEEDIDINENEVHKFLIIFHTLVEPVNSEQPQDETNGFVNDAILQISNRIAGLLRNNIDNLNISTILKSALKKLKNLFITQTKDTDEGKIGKPEPENAEYKN